LSARADPSTSCPSSNRLKAASNGTVRPRPFTKLERSACSTPHVPYAGPRGRYGDGRRPCPSLAYYCTFHRISTLGGIGSCAHPPNLKSAIGLPEAGKIVPQRAGDVSRTEWQLDLRYDVLAGVGSKISKSSWARLHFMSCPARSGASFRSNEEKASWAPRRLSRRV
jgi:hypothetical protein